MECGIRKESGVRVGFQGEDLSAEIQGDVSLEVCALCVRDLVFPCDVALQLRTPMWANLQCSNIRGDSTGKWKCGH